MNKFSFTIQDKPYEVSIDKVKNNIAEVAVNGKNLTIKIERPEPVVVKPAPMPTATPTTRPIVESKPIQNVESSEDQPLSVLKVYVNSGQLVKKDDVLFTMESNGRVCNVTADKDGVIGKMNVAIGQNLPAGDSCIELKNCSNSPAKPKAKAVATDSATTAPLPGTIVQILIPEGSAVKVGDVVLTMDSMKMVNNVVAETSGTLQSILVKEGQAVMEGDPLFVIG